MCAKIAFLGIEKSDAQSMNFLHCDIVFGITAFKIYLATFVRYSTNMHIDQVNNE